MLDVQQLGAYIDARFHAAGHVLFRLESLPAYDGETDGDDFRRWLDGATEPMWSRKQPWLDTLRRERAGGQVSRRVRILSDPLTEYERYSCEFGYAYNVPAGEDVRVLRLGEHSVPEGLERTDFWIINDVDAVLMHYDERGRFHGATPAPEELDRLRRLRDTIWPVAEPFDRWWDRHPELHRRSVIS